MNIHAGAPSPAAAVTQSLLAERPHPPPALLSVGDVCLALQCRRTVSNVFSNVSGGLGT
jgi:hypothetical protein